VEREQLLYPEISKEAYSIIDYAKKEGIRIKLLGGVGIRHITKSWALPPFEREISDIDFAIMREEIPSLLKLFRRKGLKEREIFNKINMGSRLIYYTEKGYKIDVFVDEFNMCHRIPLRYALKQEGLSLPALELLLTKLQVRNIAKKDMIDLSLILNDISLTKDESGINFERFVSICSRDWGLFTTVSENLAKLEEFSYSLQKEYGETIRNKIGRLVNLISSSKKTLRWRLRAIIGKKVRWYQIPEEIPEVFQETSF
jgi:hypothetical protein